MLIFTSQDLKEFTNMNQDLILYGLTQEEINLIQTINKVLWGTIEIIIKNGKVALIRKTTEIYKPKN